DEDRVALAGALVSVRDLRARLARAIDADTAAYDAVVAAYKQPKGTDEEKAARTRAIQSALRGATEVPLTVMRLSAEALAAAKIIAARGNPSASSDVGVAVALLRAGLEGARLNVEVNLGSIKDEAYSRAVADEAARLAGAG